MTWKKLGVAAALGFFVFVVGSEVNTRHLSSRARSTALRVKPVEVPPSLSDWHTVTRVIDGDTIEIETGEKVRYIGMNTPETVDPRKPVECFGKEASEYNRGLVESRKVRLASDVADKDKYGRLLRYVYLEDGTFINLKLVEDGFANVMTIPPDIAKAEEFRQAEREARGAGRGLWGECRH